MSSAAELFVVALARASKRAQRYVRGLDSTDREDVIATAVLWCWENRATYSPTVSLDTWFVGAIRNARKSWMRGEAREAVELVETFAVPDDTSWNVELMSAIESMVEGMDDVDRWIVDKLLDGASHASMAEHLCISVSTVKRRLARLKGTLPVDVHFKLALRTAIPGDSYRLTERKPQIDRDIERLEFMPQHGKDCPPCWRCKWFEGLLPASHRAIRLPITEPEIAAAVEAIEGRKVEIAMHVRAGTINE